MRILHHSTLFFVKVCLSLCKTYQLSSLPVRVSDIFLCCAFALVIILKRIGTFVVLILYSYLTNYCCQLQFLSGSDVQLSCMLQLQ